MSIHVITITGEVASGKSTIAKEILLKLPDWRKANTGEKFREICKARGWSIQQVSELPDEVHQEVDAWQRELAQSEENIIIEGRLSGWLTRDMPHVFRVYCWCPLEVRIERYIEREKKSVEQARLEIIYRDENDVLKYQRAYSLADYRDPGFYSLTIDTSTTTAEKLAEQIIREARIEISRLHAE
jgi:cytidylate kinase